MDSLDDKIVAKVLAAAKILDRLARVRAIYVFGSHVEGRADQWSDIDVAAFMEGIDDWDFQTRTQAMARVMIEAGADVEAHLFPASSLDHPPRGGFAEYILKHGVSIPR